MRYGRGVRVRRVLIAAVVVLTIVAGSAGVQTTHVSRAGSPTPPPAPPTGTVAGLDVSAYQHGVQWKKVASAGARFAYIKATEGSDYRSERFRYQFAGAGKAGLIRGGFHFARPNQSTPVAQARYFVSALASVGASASTTIHTIHTAPTLPPLLDLEYDPYARSDGTNSCWGLTPKQMVVWISSFIDTVTGLTGRVPAIYTTTNWWVKCTGDSADFVGNPLFLARYVDSPAEGAGILPSGWKRWTIWQYTSHGRRYAGVTSGKKGDTRASDEDLFAGTPDDLRALATSTFVDATGLQPAPRNLLPPSASPGRP